MPPRTNKTGSGQAQKAKQGKGSPSLNKRNLGASKGIPGACLTGDYAAFCEETGNDKPRKPYKTSPLVPTCSNCRTPARKNKRVCMRCIVLRRKQFKGLVNNQHITHWSVQ